ncbi:Bax inhibitor-1/YccA family protein [Brevibacterium sp. UCMA 11752]|uniref:Bax inhibitor-1/YccA family protein n=1 Tax=Brevibacterium sp. UCMA 11752 TaxID=2745946 RepID=UPI001F27BE8B|nr:Bax inhibitor-1/YccA family protein [Brevibacterium sp. UCMA 11752]MCF2588765.1 Bax inhibitor-1/YccA family protein [Brevibacterium sp. UCMA 11752]
MMNRALNQGVQAGRNEPVMSDQELNNLFDQPAAQNRNAGPQTAERAMTYDDVMMKTGVLFAILLAGAVVGWFVPPLAFPAMLIALVLGLVNAFKKEPSKALIIGYAVFEGVFLGGISAIFEAQFSGIVVQAVLATLCVFGVMLALFKFKGVRYGSKMKKFMMIAIGGYAIFSLINFGIAMFTGTGGARSIEINIMGFEMPLGVIIGIVATVLAAMTLIMDFQMIEQGVKQRIPEKYSWMCAFSLMVTLVWLYIEILRLISYFRN